MTAINEAIDSGDLDKLLKALLNQKANLNKVIAENGDWYQQTLAEAKETKVSVRPHYYHWRSSVRLPQASSCLGDESDTNYKIVRIFILCVNPDLRY